MSIQYTWIKSIMLVQDAHKLLTKVATWKNISIQYTRVDEIMLVQAVQNYLVEVVTRKGISILQIIMELMLEVHKYSDAEEPREDLCDA